MSAALQSLWQTLLEEARARSSAEPMLASFFHAAVLNHDGFPSALAWVLATRLKVTMLQTALLHEVFDRTLADCPDICEAAAADLCAHRTRDPACDSYCTPFLFYKGFHALQTHRIAHCLWRQERHWLAYGLQNACSASFAVDIHPGAEIGRGIMIDHGTGIVIGETARIGDEVSMLHGVTLGGTGAGGGDRHPKVGDGVMISAGARVLGPVRIGEGAKIGAGSLVLADVPAHRTVAGVPAQVVGKPRADMPALSMEQGLDS